MIFYGFFQNYWYSKPGFLTKITFREVVTFFITTTDIFVFVRNGLKSPSEQAINSYPALISVPLFSWIEYNIGLGISVTGRDTRIRRLLTPF